MSENFELTPSQREFCLGEDGYFYHACAEHFAFLVREHGYKMSFHYECPGGGQVRFMEDIQTEYFAVRLFYDPLDTVWCDIHRFAGTDYQRRLRLKDACRLFGCVCPSERIDLSLGPERAVPQRVQEIAACVRDKLSDFRNIPINP